MIHWKFLPLVALACVTCATAQDKLTYDCSAMKVIYGEDGRLSRFEEVASYTRTRELIPFSTPFTKFEDRAFTLGLSLEQESFSLPIGTSTLLVDHSLSVILTEPHGGEGDRWGICQFSSHLGSNFANITSQRPRGIANASVSSQRVIGDAIVKCDQMTMVRGETFWLTMSNSAVDTATEQVMFGCAYKIESSEPTGAATVTPTATPIFTVSPTMTPTSTPSVLPTAASTAQTPKVPSTTATSTPSVSPVQPLVPLEATATATAQPSQSSIPTSTATPGPDNIEPEIPKGTPAGDRTPTTDSTPSPNDTTIFGRSPPPLLFERLSANRGFGKFSPPKIYAIESGEKVTVKACVNFRRVIGGYDRVTASIRSVVPGVVDYHRLSRSAPCLSRTFTDTGKFRFRVIMSGPQRRPLRSLVSEFSIYSKS